MPRNTSLYNILNLQGKFNIPPRKPKRKTGIISHLCAILVMIRSNLKETSRADLIIENISDAL
jgi:hypothetical protein